MSLTLRPGRPEDAEMLGLICYEAFKSIGLYNEPAGPFMPSVLF